MTFSPRDYQVEAHDEFWSHVTTSQDDGIVVFPTGAGKTLLLAMLSWTAVNRYGGRVLIVTHRKELIRQQHDTIRKLCPDLELGIYSAGLKRRDTGSQVLLAGVQSVFRRVNEIGPRHLVIVDEAHLISPSEETMYGRLISELRAMHERMRIVGLTATPFRLEDGPLCSPDGRFRKVIYRVGVKKLLDDGHICPIINSPDSYQFDGLDSLPKKGGEFVTSDLQRALNTDETVSMAVKHSAEIIKKDGRNSTLVFATGIDHGEHICAEFIRNGFDAHVVFGDTPPDERDYLLKAFKAGDINLIVNCDVLTTGFDAERIDCIVSYRPTMSPGLWMQMVGRGFRKHPSKENCLVLDYGGNFLRHGPIDSDSYGLNEEQKEAGTSEPGETPVKSCINCSLDIYIQARVCPHCGVEQPTKDQDPSHDSIADFHSPVYEEEQGEWLEVKRVEYHHNYPKSDDKLSTLRVEYYVEGREFPVREWVCVLHEGGFALEKAQIWWRERCIAVMPRDVDSAVYCGEHNMLAEPSAILVGPDHDNPRWERVYGFRLGPKPAEEDWGKQAKETFGMEELNEEDIPF